MLRAMSGAKIWAPLVGVWMLAAGGIAVADAPASPRSSSIGTPDHGRLIGAVRLRQSDSVRFVRYYTARGNVYATPELTALLERVGQRVGTLFPGARLSVGELSRRRGGDIAGHAGHESGREADVSFYLLDQRGMPHEPERYATIRADGTAEPPFESLRLDEVRTWALVDALLADADVPVVLIYVSNPVRERLLAAGRAAGAGPATLERAAQVMRQPASGHPHANHLHIRIACPADDRPGCRG
jgi:penicillin-insensitive murein endopeptidase